jgi:uncharacterized membrane protein YdjX (TVP38/TMEM64 family)
MMKQFLQKGFIKIIKSTMSGVTLEDELIQFFLSLLQNYGYIGVFLVEVLGNATVIFPIPSILVTAAASTILDPWILTIVSAVGATIGESTGYLLGLGGRRMLESRLELKLAEDFYRRYGIWSIAFFAATPLPFDIIGILCGALKIRLRTFFAMTLAGKVVMKAIVIFGGKRTIDVMTSFLTGKLDIYGVLYLMLIVVLFIGSWLYWRFLIKKHAEKMVEEAS